MLSLLIILAILCILLILLYNRLVALRNNRENAFADIDVQLRQRHDLIPQLVESVKGYMTHEKELLERITKARTDALQAGTIHDKIISENQLSSALQGLKIAVEAYPDLKANTNFLQLQSEIADIENKLAAVRRFFNNATKELNTAVESFPSNLIANAFGFSREDMFDVGFDNRASLEAKPDISFK